MGQDAQSGQLVSLNPATGEVLGRYPVFDSRKIQTCIAQAQERFQEYRWIPFAQRAAWMERVAEILLERKAEFGRLITLEMGKTLASAIAEVEKSAWVCRYYAETAAGFLAEQLVASDASCSGIRYQPLGVILAVMPWNFPFWQVFRCAAPALMAGNTLLLKHASNVPQSALCLEAIFREAGFPQGVFQTLLISAAQVAEVVADERVRGAALTGSEAAGSSLARLAGQHLKKTVLELGGSDPFIVLPSADLEAAVSTAVTARLISNGQSCIAAKRFIVHSTIAESFTAALVERFRQLKVGDPLDPQTEVGPLATPSILQEVDGQVQALVQAGAKVWVGGSPLGGNFYLPTVLSGIPAEHPVAQQEVFGPVALLFEVPDLEAAIRLANSTPFGLGASAWTTDPNEQERLLMEIEAGSVFINGLVKSDPRLPFGGIKRSGYGRELSREGILEFVNIKTFWVK
ncbi:NAD-dependent succinate-semialdehyde dehydrogenase [Synechococcus bigranulatus str. 'Rupite']|uniref:NAD-dependent succinate-semialdehyde dehydrogenase n=2 Tax=Thermostichus vulcanus TaxID=32053 RepID=A0ABT0C9X4_THEVL|nr:NAD-dependent succinate-semialdehyde dehydrogenase [Thermostichus vulcanus str. 'Rupite']